MKTCIFILLSMFFLSSCKKDLLENDKVYLVGKWKWTYSEHSYGWCNYSPLFNTIDSTSDKNTYSVEFLEKGIIVFYKNEKKVEKGRIVFDYFEMVSNDEFIFFFNVNGKEDKPMFGSGNVDTLRITYPYVEADPNCENYLNFFVRE